MEKSDLERRIEHLEDDRFEKMLRQINELHAILLGNGKEGLTQTVAKLSARQKLVCWILSVMIGAIVGSYFRNASNIDKQAFSKAIVEELSGATNNIVVQ